SAPPSSSGSSSIASSTRSISSSTSGLSAGSTFRHLLATSFILTLMLPSSAAGGFFAFPLWFASSGNRQSPPSTHMLRLPPVSSERASKGLLPTRHAYSVHPRLQISTFVSIVVLTCTSKSSGARYG